MRTINKKLKRDLSALLAVCLFLVQPLSMGSVRAQGITSPTGILNLPAPGTMAHLSPAYKPALLNGLRVFTDNPLRLDFIIDKGDSGLEGEALRYESTKLIKYFLAALTISEDDLWVNLSPYEKDRIIPEAFSKTEMGRDLLSQDYMLKQLTASLMYPEKELGKEFWDKVYKRVQEKFATTEIPVNTFNKVWIVPETAGIYKNKDRAFVVDSHLKVMLEQDYFAMQRAVGTVHESPDQEGTVSDVSSAVIREVIIPAIEKEVNEGKNFTQLRQIYHAVILATWFKRNLRESMLGQVYVDREKIAGVDVADKKIKEKIYQQYLDAFHKGVFNLIKKEYSSTERQLVPRKYFSGGTALTLTQGVIKEWPAKKAARQVGKTDDAVLAQVDLAQMSASPGVDIIVKDWEKLLNISEPATFMQGTSLPFDTRKYNPTDKTGYHLEKSKGSIVEGIPFRGRPFDDYKEKIISAAKKLSTGETFDILDDDFQQSYVALNNMGILGDRRVVITNSFWKHIQTLFKPQSVESFFTDFIKTFEERLDTLDKKYGLDFIESWQNFIEYEYASGHLIVMTLADASSQLFWSDTTGNNSSGVWIGLNRILYDGSVKDIALSRALTQTALMSGFLRRLKPPRYLQNEIDFQIFLSALNEGNISLSDARDAIARLGLMDEKSELSGLLNWTILKEQYASNKESRDLESTPESSQKKSLEQWLGEDVGRPIFLRDDIPREQIEAMDLEGFGDIFKHPWFQWKLTHPLLSEQERPEVGYMAAAQEEIMNGVFNDGKTSLLYMLNEWLRMLPLKDWGKRNGMYLWDIFNDTEWDTYYGNFQALEKTIDAFKNPEGEWNPSSTFFTGGDLNQSAVEKISWKFKNFVNTIKILHTLLKDVKSERLRALRWATQAFVAPNHPYDLYNFGQNISNETILDALENNDKRQRLIYILNAIREIDYFVKIARWSLGGGKEYYNPSQNIKDQTPDKDAWLNFARVLPQDDSRGPYLEIKGGVAPRVITSKGAEEVVPNDLRLGNSRQEKGPSIELTTGPNFYGKTSRGDMVGEEVLKALNAIPSNAEVELTMLRVRVFNRTMVGQGNRADNPEQGLSGFPTELQAINRFINDEIVNNPYTLAILDEVPTGSETENTAAYMVAFINKRLLPSQSLVLWSNHNRLAATQFLPGGDSYTDKVRVAHVTYPTYKVAPGLAPTGQMVAAGRESGEKAQLPPDLVEMAGEKAEEFYSATEEKGGIDLNPSLINLNTDGEEIKFDPASSTLLIDAAQLRGFSPVIFQIIPITNLPFLLGMEEGEAEDSVEQLSYSGF